MASVIDTVKIFCEKLGWHKTFYVALSGGLDSTVLLHVCLSLRAKNFPIQLKIIHAHHGLSQNADTWLQHAEQMAKKFQIECIAEKIMLQTALGESIEAAARNARYGFFAQHIHKEAVLLTAHQQDDQAETFLLQLFRGAGTKGLSAMPALKSFAEGLHGRPLLSISRELLKQYAEENNLYWIDDESNTNTRFTRNFLRHEVLPLLQSRWPTIQDALARTATHCQNVEMLLVDYIAEDLEKSRGSLPKTLSVKKLLRWDPLRQQQILREFIVKQNFILPSTIKMQHILQDVLQANVDRFPCVSWSNIELRRYRDDLYIMQKINKPSFDSLTWNFQEPLLIGNHVLQAEEVMNEGLCATLSEVTVRFRVGGEKLQLPGRPHSHDLKKLFQQWGVPPWLRKQIPLIFVGEELAAVVGFCVAEKFVATQKGWKILFT